MRDVQASLGDDIEEGDLLEHHGHKIKQPHHCEHTEPDIQGLQDVGGQATDFLDSLNLGGQQLDGSHFSLCRSSQHVGVRQGYQAGLQQQYDRAELAVACYHGSNPQGLRRGLAYLLYLQGLAVQGQIEGLLFERFETGAV
jgi:hypothetical protein